MSSFTSSQVTKRILAVDSAIRRGVRDGNIVEVMKAQKEELRSLFAIQKLGADNDKAAFAISVYLWGFIVAWKKAGKQADGTFLEAQRRAMDAFDMANGSPPPKGPAGASSARPGPAKGAAAPPTVPLKPQPPSAPAPRPLPSRQPAPGPAAPVPPVPAKPQALAAVAPAAPLPPLPRLLPLPPKKPTTATTVIPGGRVPEVNVAVSARPSAPRPPSPPKLTITGLPAQPTRRPKVGPLSRVRPAAPMGGEKKKTGLEEKQARNLKRPRDESEDEVVEIENPVKKTRPQGESSSRAPAPAPAPPKKPAKSSRHVPALAQVKMDPPCDRCVRLDLPCWKNERGKKACCACHKVKTRCEITPTTATAPGPATAPAPAPTQGAPPAESSKGRVIKVTQRQRMSVEEKEKRQSRRRIRKAMAKIPPRVSAPADDDESMDSDSGSEESDEPSGRRFSQVEKGKWKAGAKATTSTAPAQTSAPAPTFARLNRATTKDDLGCQIEELRERFDQLDSTSSSAAVNYVDISEQMKKLEKRLEALEQEHHRALHRIDEEFDRQQKLITQLKEVILEQEEKQVWAESRWDRILDNHDMLYHQLQADIDKYLKPHSERRPDGGDDEESEECEEDEGDESGEDVGDESGEDVGDEIGEDDRSVEDDGTFEKDAPVDEDVTAHASAVQQPGPMDVDAPTVPGVNLILPTPTTSQEAAQCSTVPLLPVAASLPPPPPSASPPPLPPSSAPPPADVLPPSPPAISSGSAQDDPVSPHSVSAPAGPVPPGPLLLSVPTGVEARPGRSRSSSAEPRRSPRLGPQLAKR